MKKDRKSSGNSFKRLRQQAETLLGQQNGTMKAPSPEETRKLVHELHTHQIELELQNEELRRTQEKLLTTQKKYMDLYDFAPVGYLSISEKGLILEANLAAAELLGVERAYLGGQPFSAFIIPEDQTIHYLCRNKLFETRLPQSCELRLRSKTGSFFHAIAEIVVDPEIDGSSGIYRVAIIDISEQKHLEDALKKSKEDLELRNQINSIFLYFPDSEMFGELLELVRRRMKSQFGTFGYFDDNGRFIAPAVTRKAYWDQCNVEGKDIIFEKGLFWGIWRRALEEKETKIANSGPFLTPAGHVPIENTIVAPIIFDDKVISVMHLANKSGGYDAEDQHRLETIVGLIAPVLNARLQRDIRDRQLVEAARAWQHTFDAIPDFVSIHDIDYRFTRINKALTDFLGLREEDLLGKKCYEAMHSTDHPIDGCPHQASIQNGQTVVYNEVSHNLGIPLEVTCAPIFAQDGSILGTVHVARDITERQKAEAEIQDARAFAENLIKTANAMVIGLNTKGEITVFNNAAENISGYTKSELGKRNWFEVLVPRTRYPDVWEEFSRLEEGNLPKYYSNPILTKTGEERYILWSNSVISEKGQITGTISFGIDITERKKGEVALEEIKNRLQKLNTHLLDLGERERTAIAREIHDDLGQVLTALKMDLGWIEKRLPRDEKAIYVKLDIMREMLDGCVKGIKTLCTRLRPGILDDLGIVAALEWYVSDFETRAKIPCNLVLPQEAVSVGDAASTAAYRILQESLTNVARHAKADKVDISLISRDGRLILTVVDDGRGITHKALSATDSYGLMGMHERAEAVGGTFRVGKRPDGHKGTHLELTIPL